MTALPGLQPAPGPATAGRARRRCRNPECRRWVFLDRAIFGFGRCCAAHLRVTAPRWAPIAQDNEPDLFTEAHMHDHPRRFLLLDTGRSVLAEGVQFSDGGGVVYRLDQRKYATFDALAACLGVENVAPELVNLIGATTLEWIDPEGKPRGPS